MHVDAIVIGGGPAGSLTARGLAIRGWKTVLIEHGPRHRDKTCGHCLSPRAMRILQQHGMLEAVRAIAVGLTGHLNVHGSNGSPLTMPLIDHTVGRSLEPGLLTPRQHLDQVLIDAAKFEGVEVLQPASAHLHREADGARSVTIRGGPFDGLLLFAKLIVGADGVGSAVARTTESCGNTTVGRKFAFSFDVHADQTDMVHDGSVAIEMIVLPDGYLGVVRQRDGTLHCAGLVSENSQKSSRKPMTFARHAFAQLHNDHEWSSLRIDPRQVTHFTATGPMPWRPSSVADRQVALVGDAAGYIEPFTGEGMAWAMHSASLLLACLDGQTPGCWNRALANAYERQWRHCIGRRQCACRAVAFALARPKLRGLTLGVARRCPAIPRRFVKWVHA